MGYLVAKQLNNNGLKFSGPVYHVKSFCN